MDLLDVAIAILFIITIVRGAENGFVRQFFATVGFLAGLFAGVVMEGRLAPHLPLHTRPLWAVAVVGVTTILLSTVGEYAGLQLKYRITKNALGNGFDSGIGAIMGAATLLVGVWLGASVFRNAPESTMQRQIRASRIVAILDNEFPNAPSVITKLGHLISPNNFPQVFAGLEPRVSVQAPLPDIGELNAALAQDRPSVVKIEGEGCGGIVEGSGFVASQNVVVTNAHVVAGVAQPAILDQAGTHRAAVVAFDPNLDIAILRTKDLSDPPLTLHTAALPAGTATAILGYPGGGPFNAAPAAILETFAATGHNIYNQGETQRTVYSIKGDVEQGNSGGPLVIADGSVVGVVFAKSTSYSQVGYALTMQQVAQSISRSTTATTAVPTGSCAE